MAAHINEYPVGRMCRVFKISRSGYYAWLRRGESARSIENKRLLNKIRAVYISARKLYGSPRIYMKLLADGELCGKCRVARLMSANGIRAKRKRKYVVTTDSKHDLPIAANLLKRNFTAHSPDKVWLTDITYIPTDEGWLYKAAVMDLNFKGIVGWSMGKSLESQLVIDALKMAYERRKPARGLIVHSDRGSQYASEAYRKLVESYGMQMSMSRKGDCWDNAPMESFFATLKKELVHQCRYLTRRQARRDIFDYVEVFYNRTRLHSSLGYMSPTDFENISKLRRAA